MDNLQEKELHQLQQIQDKAKESCMAYFRLLHSLFQDSYCGLSNIGGRLSAPATIMYSAKVDMLIVD